MKITDHRLAATDLLQMICNNAELMASIQKKLRHDD